MKKKMSLSFLVLSILTLLTAIDTVKILWDIPAAFQELPPKLLGLFLVSLVCAVTPTMLVVLLVANAEQSVKKSSFPLLLVLGAAWLVFGLVELDLFFLQDAFVLQLLLFYLPDVIIGISHILIGVMLFIAAFCIRLQKKSKVLTVSAFIGCYLNLVPLAMSVLQIGFYNPPHQALTPLLLMAGISLLPATVSDYENCTFVDKKTLKSIGLLAAVFLGVVLITRLK